MEFTHFDDQGNARMVDVSDKDTTERAATATGSIQMNQEAMDAILQKKVKKGDVLTVAQVAGIMAAKHTSDLIPMCHPLALTKAEVTFKIEEEKQTIHVFCTTKLKGRTGVEMEALTGAMVSLLTIYDMCKAIDRSMTIREVHLVEKMGGKSGHFFYQEGSGAGDCKR